MKKTNNKVKYTPNALSDHIVEIDGVKYVPYDIAVKAIDVFADDKFEEALNALKNIKIEVND